MEALQKCLNCQTPTSYLGNNPSPVILQCKHTVCLNCVNSKQSSLLENNQIEFQCPLQSCAFTTNIPLEVTNLQSQFTRQLFQSQIQVQQVTPKVIYKCNIHQKKPIEFRCIQCKEVFCSLCMLLHSKHSENVEVFTEDEIVKETNYLINLNQEAIQHYEQTLNSNKEMLQKLLPNQDGEIYSDQIQQTFMSVTQNLTSQYIKDQSQFNDLQNKYQEAQFLIDSKILSQNKQKKLLYSLFGETVYFNLLMRGTTDGFQNFFEKCSQQGKTLILIQDTNNNIFGSFNGLQLEKGNCDLEDLNSFLFSFIKEGEIIQCNYKQQQKQQLFVSNLKNVILLFNYGSALTIYANCNVVNNNQSVLGSNYESKNLQNNSLAGQEQFQVKEMEVYQVLV